MTSVSNGQITSMSSMGQVISDLAANKEYKTYLEIGTWRGGGSTKCFADSILKRHDSVKFISIECNKSMHDEAVRLWENHLSEKFLLLHGRIVEEHDLLSESSIMKENDYTHEWSNWLQQDIVAMRTCKNLLSTLPEKIDVVLLDGGEFSSYAEYKKLLDRTNLFILDDTRPLKNRLVRKELLADSQWDCLIDKLDERQGYSVFKRNIKGGAV